MKTQQIAYATTRANPQRQRQALALAQWLGLELQSVALEAAGQFGEMLPPPKILLVDYEDMANVPRADGRNLFVGVFCQSFPHSQEIFKQLDLQISFLWQEDASVESLREIFEDLFA